MARRKSSAKSASRESDNTVHGWYSRLDLHLPAWFWLPLSTAVTAIFLCRHGYHDVFNVTSDLHMLNASDNVMGDAVVGGDVMDDDVREYYEWTPMETAGIYDLVDDTGFRYNKLDALVVQQIRVDGRDIVPLELKPQKDVNTTARVYIIDDILSEDECDILRDLHDSHIAARSIHDPFICFGTVDTLQYHLDALNSSTQVNKNMFYPGTRCASHHWSSKLKKLGLSWSHATGFFNGESQFSYDLGKRFEKVTGFADVNGAGYRVVSYPENTDYRYHTDCVVDNSKGDGDRFGTILVYLNDVAAGGHTYFSELGISVKPKKGRALVWNNLSPEGICDPNTLHKAMPVIQGTKYILQRWYVHQNYATVSKRPPIPPLPKRHPTVAMVSCDEYRNGSCRWYDSWTYDIMLRY